MTTGATKNDRARLCLGISMLCAGFMALPVISDLNGIIIIFLLLLCMAAAAWHGFRKHPEDAEEGLICSALLFGLSIPVLNFFGSGALLALSCFFLALVSARLYVPLAWGAPWLTVLGASVLAELWYSYDFLQISAALGSYSGLNFTLQEIHQVPPLWLTTMLQFARWAVLLQMLAVTAEFGRLRESMIRGVQLGLILSLSVTGWQYVHHQYSHLPAQAGFWQAQGRYAGSFSDPNAFGLAALLLTGLSRAPGGTAGWWGRILKLISGVFILLALLLSGSRTLLLGLLLLVCLQVPLLRRRWPLLLAAGVSLLVSYRAISFERIAPLMTYVPPSIERAARSLHPEAATDTLSSRGIFLRLGVAIWKDNPLFGVGLGRFRENVPEYARTLGISLNGWMDNSNNFYLGILCEIGLLGIIGFIWMLMSLRLEEGLEDEEVVAARRTVFVFSLILLTGPHLDFDEIALLFALVLAQAGIYVPFQVNGKSRLAFACAALPLVLMAHVAYPKGFFDPERSPEGEYRWTSRRASWLVSCDAEGHAIIPLQTFDQKVGGMPLVVELEIDGQPQTLSISDWAIHLIPVNCRPGSVAGSFHKAHVHLALSRLFMARAGLDGDHRRLGVRIFRR